MRCNTIGNRDVHPGLGVTRGVPVAAVHADRLRVMALAAHFGRDLVSTDRGDLVEPVSASGSIDLLHNIDKAAARTVTRFAGNSFARRRLGNGLPVLGVGNCVSTRLSKAGGVTTEAS